MRLAPLLLPALFFGMTFGSSAASLAGPETAPITLAAPAVDQAITGSIAAATPPPMPRMRPVPTVGRPSLEEMIGQMILIGFPGQGPGNPWPARVAGWIHESRIGGVVLFADNIANPDQVKALIARLKQASPGLMPFVCIDQEGGAIQRLTAAKGFDPLPSAAHVATLSEQAAYKLYSRTANELMDLGINVNFGPVVDLNVNPNNPAIGQLGRSFARDPEKVIAFAREFINAHEQAGVLVAIKHFPGHGSAVNDPHSQIVDISRTWRTVELDPFQRLISGKFVDMLMVGHLIHPRFSDKGNLPASLSKKTIEGALRGDLKFRGLVITDDLDMGAIRSRFSVEQAAVMAIAAGADLIIVSNHKAPEPAIVDRIIAAVARAVDEGRISREQIRDAYQLIVQEKAKLADLRAYAME